MCLGGGVSGLSHLTVSVCALARTEIGVLNCPLCALVCTENGVLIVLELVATFDGGTITTESKFNILSFMQEEQRTQAFVMAVCLFVSLVFILLLSLMQLASVIQQACASQGISTSDLFEVFYDISQGARSLPVVCCCVLLFVCFCARLTSG